MATTEAVDVVMPQMGVSVSEGTITKWLKQEGEQIEADESLLEISTDKVDTEVPSPASGIVTQILVQEGETVEVGTKLAVIGGEAGAPAPGARGSARARDGCRSRRGAGTVERRDAGSGPCSCRAGSRTAAGARRRTASRTRRASCRRSSRASRPSTASTSRASPARAAGDE